MKKLFALMLTLLLFLPLLTLGENYAGTITIGIFEPASGDNAAGGKQETLGMYYANSLVNTVELDGKTYKVEVTEVDNQTSADKAPAAAQTLVSRNVNVVLGTYGSGASMAAAPIFEAANIPAIGASCTNPGVTLGYPLYWRICYTDDFQGDVLANFAFNDLDVKVAYTLNMLGEDYGAGLVNYFTKAFEKLGGKVVADTFPEGTSDFSAYLQNAVNSGAGVIFSPSSTTYASLMLGQASSMNLEIPFVAGDTWASSVILEAVQNSKLKVYFSDFFDESDKDATQVSKDFVTGFKAWLNANPDKLTNNGGNDIIAAVSALGFDSYMTAIEAIKKTEAGTKEQIAEALPGVDYEGVTGKIVFDENGDAKKDIAYILAGVSVGGQYALIAIGYTMVYGILRLINFAHGDIFTVAGFFMVYMNATMPLYISIPLTIILTVILGFTVERVAYKPLREAPRMSIMISAIGVSYLLQNLMWYVTGGLAKQYPVIPWISSSVTVWVATTKIVTLITPIITIVMVIMLQQLINHTKIGMAMRAVSRDFETAKLMGIQINRVISVSFIIGSFLAAVGSLLYFSNYATVTPTVGAMPGLKAFVAAVFGGIGSIPGAVIGAFIIGISENLIKALGYSTFSDAFTFALLIFVLLAKPTGLFGEKTIDKV